MNNALKMVTGILLMAAGIYWYIGNIPYFGSELWRSLKIVFEGVFGLFLFFLGLLIAWIAWDDYKMNKLLEEEELEGEEETPSKEKKTTKNSATSSRKRASSKKQ